MAQEGEKGRRTMSAGVFLDRDGTLIDVVRDEETGAVSVAFHPDQLRLLPGVVDGLHLLVREGYVLGIATNQPAPAKGQFSVAAVKRTNDALVLLLAEHGVRIAAVQTCMHHPEGGPGGDASLVGPCECRKPRPGLLDALVAELGVSRAASWMIGDSVADIDAGRAAGVKTALVFAPNRCELCPLRPPLGGAAGASAMAAAHLPDVTGSTFVEVARAIVASGQGKR
jgi:D-glycero-D-manno-heptose 1,7-bisphosphate phosphatase